MARNLYSGLGGATEAQRTKEGRPVRSFTDENTMFGSRAIGSPNLATGPGTDYKQSVWEGVPGGLIKGLAKSDKKLDRFQRADKIKTDTIYELQRKAEQKDLMRQAVAPEGPNRWKSGITNAQRKAWQTAGESAYTKSINQSKHLEEQEKAKKTKTDAAAKAKKGRIAAYEKGQYTEALSTLNSEIKRQQRLSDAELDPDLKGQHDAAIVSLRGQKKALQANRGAAVRGLTAGVGVQGEVVPQTGTPVTAGLNQPAQAIGHTTPSGKPVVPGQYGTLPDGTRVEMTESGELRVLDRGDAPVETRAAPGQVTAGLGSADAQVAEDLGGGSIYEPSPQRAPGAGGKVLSGLLAAPGKIAEGLIRGFSGRGPDVGPELSDDVSLGQLAASGPDVGLSVPGDEPVAMFSQARDLIAKAFPEAPDIAEQMQARMNLYGAATNEQEKGAALQEIKEFVSMILEFMDNSRAEATLGEGIDPLVNKAKEKMEAFDEGGGFTQLLKDIIASISGGANPSGVNNIPANVRNGVGSIRG